MPSRTGLNLVRRYVGKRGTRSRRRSRRQRVA